MPNKFSSFSPSGRKELLEKLTKSDFMIEDIKNRVLSRQEFLNKKIREYEDSLLVNTTQQTNISTKLAALKNELANIEMPDYEKEILDIQKKISDITDELTIENNNILQYEKQVESLSTELLENTNKKSEATVQELTAYNEAVNKANNEKYKLEAIIESLIKEIKQLQEISDICPTCKQKLPGVTKPSTEIQNANLTQNQQALASVTANLANYQQKHEAYCKEISLKFDNLINSLQQELATLKQQLSQAKSTVAANNTQLEVCTERLNKLQFDKLNIDKYCNSLKSNINEFEKNLNQLNNLIQISLDCKIELSEHLAVIKKMDSLIKRDFRGFLLTNIINYIDQKAKDYCEIVFNTRDLNIYLDGNALDISYCNKMFDNLSGGEKQRVDLILQFAIRDMLNSYLNASSNMLVLDEITDFLDKQSCAAIMTLLEKELNTVESVFIISHHANELDLPIDSELKIIKNELGISEVY